MGIGRRSRASHRNGNCLSRQLQLQLQLCFIRDDSGSSCSIRRHRMRGSDKGGRCRPSHGHGCRCMAEHSAAAMAAIGRKERIMAAGRAVRVQHGEDNQRILIVGCGNLWGTVVGWSLHWHCMGRQGASGGAFQGKSAITPPLSLLWYCSRCLSCIRRVERGGCRAGSRHHWSSKSV